MSDLAGPSIHYDFLLQLTKELVMFDLLNVWTIDASCRSIASMIFAETISSDECSQEKPIRMYQ